MATSFRGFCQMLYFYFSSNLLGYQESLTYLSSDKVDVARHITPQPIQTLCEQLVSCIEYPANKFQTTQKRSS